MRAKTAGKALATAAVLAGLFVTSRQYNRWIDRRIYHTPGATALQVVGGTAYTLAGIAVIMAVWQGLRSAAAFVVVAIAGFAAAGYPMLIGDINRDER